MYEKGAVFLKKGPQILHLAPPYSIPFLSVLYQILYNFRKRGQRSIVECNISLEYALHTQTIRRLLLTNFLSVFDHFVGLAFRGLTII